MYIGMCVYNSLNKLVRRIITMLKSKRDILILALAFMFAQFPAYYLYIVNTDWNKPTWGIIFEVATIIIGLTIIIIVLRYLLKRLDTFYTKEDSS